MEMEFAKTLTMTRASDSRRSVVCTDTYVDDVDMPTPVYGKDQRQKEVILMAVIGSLLFGSLRPETTNQVVDAFKGPIRVPAGQAVIVEGARVEGNEAGLYILEQGWLEAYKSDQGVDPPGTCLCSYTKPGQIFGDLALLYNCPRAASVIAKEESVLWTLDRASFNKCVKGSNMQHRDKLDKFFASVEILSSLSNEDRNKICDVIMQRDYLPGDRIIRKGEEGLEFFLVMRGSAQAKKDDQVVQDYSSGHYFGELALLENKPRSLDVYAGDSEGASVAVLDNASFKRLLGPLSELLAERAKGYKSLSDAPTNPGVSKDTSGPRTPAAVQAFGGDASAGLASGQPQARVNVPLPEASMAKGAAPVEPVGMPFGWLCCSCGVKAATTMI